MEGEVASLHGRSASRVRAASARPPPALPHRSEAQRPPRLPWRMLGSMQRAHVLAGLALVAACGPTAAPEGASQTPAATYADLGHLANEVPSTDLWPERNVAGYDPRRSIHLVSIAAHPWDGDDAGSAHFRDVMEHTTPRSRWTKPDVSPSTIGHETHHGLVAENEIRGDAPADFFYFERGFGAYVPSPRQGLRLLRKQADGTPVYTPDAHTNLRHARAFLSDGAKKLTASRYQTYLADQDRETYSVLYLFDEWNAYLAGAQIAIETYAAGYYAPFLEDKVNPDGSHSRITNIGVLDGMIDFLYFSSAGVLALAESEPEYLRTNEQLRAVYALFAEETMRRFDAGNEIGLFRSVHAVKVLDDFRTSPANQPMRDYLTGWLGAEFTHRVFGW